MSSFICSAKHFNSVEQKLKYLIWEDDFYFPYSIKNIAPELYNCKFNEYSAEAKEERIHSLIDTLREINVMCVCLQYKHHYIGTLDAEINQSLTQVKSPTEIETLSIPGLFQALKCIDYQIEVEHLKELRDLSQYEENALFFLRELKTSIAFDLANKYIEKESVKWEID